MFLVKGGAFSEPLKSYPMSVWLTIPVTRQPSLTLRNWSVYQLPDGKRHFVGYCIENFEGRVSSEIKAFDPNTLRGTTATGRVYQLQGSPGLNSDAQYVWNAWARINRIDSWTDCTDAVWFEHLDGRTEDHVKPPGA